MKTKIITGFLTLVMVATLFAGCGASGGATSGSVAPAAPSSTSASESTAAAESVPTDLEPATLTLWHTWGEGPGLDAMQKIIESYNTSNGKGIEIKDDFIANRASGNTQTMDKLMAAIAAGNPPEIALLDNFQVPTWAAQEALAPLDDLMANAGASFDGVYSWAVEGGMYNGQSYSIPFNSDTRALFYNKDMFAAAGLDPEKPPKTIAELEEYAEKLTVKEGSTFKQMGFIPWQNAGRPIYTWGWSFGGSFYDKSRNTLTVNDPKIIEAVNWEIDFARKFNLKDFVEFTSGLEGGAQDPFVTGILAMAVRGNFDIANMAQYNPDLNYGIAPIPSKNAGENITWAGGWGFTIPKGAKHQEQAVDFMVYCMSEEMQNINVEMSSTLAIRNSVNEKQYKDNPLYTSFLATIDSALIRPPVPVGQKLWDGLINVLEESTHEKDTPENLLNALNTSINEDLAKIK